MPAPAMSDTVPRGHDRHSTSPCAAYFPAWHSSHKVLPVMLETVPAGQSRHLASATLGKYCPGWQMLQSRTSRSYQEPMPHDSGRSSGGVVVPPLKKSGSWSTLRKLVLGAELHRLHVLGLCEPGYSAQVVAARTRKGRAHHLLVDEQLKHWPHRLEGNHPSWDRQRAVVLVHTPQTIGRTHD